MLKGSFLKIFSVFALLVALVSFSAVGPATAEGAEPESTICGEDGKSIVRLYRAYFDRLPDQKGLEYWGGVYESGDLHDVAYWMSQSQEFQKRWEGKSGRYYVEYSLYRNLLRRAPDEKGLNYWDDDVDKVGRDAVALYWVQQPELVKKHPVSDEVACGKKAPASGYSYRYIPGGKVVDVDYYKVDVKTSSKRCSTASINANWLYLSNSQPIGLAVIDGQVINPVDLASRGVIGERYTGHTTPPASILDDWSGDVMKDYIFVKDGRTLEHEYSYRDTSASNWRWAASGISLITDGDVSSHLTPSVLADYTHGTFGHSFVATKPGGTLTFGSTTGMNVEQLVSWAQGQGYTNLVKMDGGGSVEFNIGGSAVVAGTGRNIPVWLGIGC